MRIAYRSAYGVTLRHKFHSNFNHERWVMTTSSARAQRGIVEECLKWVSQRKAFGKPLASQAVVRSKIAAMIARVESVQSWLENITHQMNNMVRLLQFEGQSRRAERMKNSRTRNKRSTSQGQLPC
jgi:alkylation response protein AidB-like acyl-CoA dehydrogenase